MTDKLPLDDEAPRPGGAAMRAVWICVGVLALALGAIGAVLPLLPTTPFVLLAAFAFTRSSPRLRARLEGSRAFGPIIRDWEASGAIAPRYKALACTMMGISLVGSIALGLALWVIAIQSVFLSGAAAYVLSRPSGEKK